MSLITFIYFLTIYVSNDTFPLEINSPDILLFELSVSIDSSPFYHIYIYIYIFKPSLISFVFLPSSSSFPQSSIIGGCVISGHSFIALSKVSQLVSALFSCISLCIISAFSVSVGNSPSSSSKTIYFTHSNYFCFYHQVPHFHYPP